MANKTVYPYGTNGELPSSIGLVNDLVTGGADKALAAEQGRVIGEVLWGDTQLIDLNLLTISNFSLAASTWVNNGLHIAVPVTPGEKYKLEVTYSETTSSFYGFLTSSYSPPSVATETVPYVSGSGGRLSLSKGNSVNITIPQGTAYLCLCPRDGSRYTSDFHLEKQIVDTSHNVIEELVDNSLASETTQIDTSSLTISNGCITNAKTWNITRGKHIAVPVTPGTYIKFRCYNASSDGNFYGFFTSSYTPPTTNAQEAPLAYGCNRVWCYVSSGYVTKLVPYSAAYIILQLEDGSSNTAMWDIYQVENVTMQELIEDGCLKTEDIVDNFDDGGVNKPLSAERGKILGQSLLSGGIPAGITKSQYSGPLVNVGTNHYVASMPVAQITNISCQGGACYGDYLFMFNAGTTCWMYNLGTNTLVQTITIDSSEQNDFSSVHCNSANFGFEFYSQDDPFPLLYVSTGSYSGGYSGVLVYRVVATTSGSTTTYSLSLVQLIKLPGSEWTEFIVGEDNDCYIKYTDINTIYRMPIPKLSQGNLTLDYNNALKVYHFTPQPDWFNGSSNQGHVYHNGRIYLVSGVPAHGEKALFIAMNLATETREVVIDLEDAFGFTGEPEGCFIWREHICIVYPNNIRVYALYFE